MPKDIASDPGATVRGENAVGATSVLLTIDGTGASGGSVVDLEFRNANMLVRHVRRISGALTYTRKADLVVHEYNSGIVDYPSLGLHLLDLRWKRLFGRHVRAVVFHGSDLRPLDPAWTDRYGALGTNAHTVAKRVRIARKAADLIYLKTPDLCHLIPEAKWLPQAVSIDETGFDTKRMRRPGALRVAHAPTKRGLKGTDAIIAACDDLKASGLDVSLDLIEGVTHRDALLRMAAADVVLDQLLVGWYGVTAIEAMALGKPVLCHIDDELVCQAGERPPIIPVDASGLPGTLRELVSGRLDASDLAALGREYYRRVHSSEAVARRLLVDAVRFAEGAT